MSMSVTTHSDRCLHTKKSAERSYCHHITPLRSLPLESSSAVATIPSMATYIAATPHLYPLFFPLVAHLSKFVQDHYTLAPRWYRRADSDRRWEHPPDMASTLLWPSIVRLLSTPQPLGNRGISLIHSSGWTKLLGMEGNFESVAVFTGDSGIPLGQGYRFASEVARSTKVH